MPRGSLTVNVAPCPSPGLSAWTVPPVQLDDVPDDREPEPEPAVRPRDAAVGLAEAIEDEWAETPR